MQDDDDDFRQLVKGIKPLEQDKHVFRAGSGGDKQKLQARKNATATKQAEAMFAFSDMYQAHFDHKGPLRFCRDDVPAYVLKQLRRGEYSPQWVLDCHGMTREQMKQELVALLYAAEQEQIVCVNILHGIGSGVLKTALPNYLIQHPLVKAFHQAPLEYGGQGAILVLLDSPHI